MTSLPLSESVSAILNASGNATVRIGPNAPGVVWKPTVVAVRTSTAVLSPVCQVYAGSSATPDNFVDGTFTGQQNNTDGIAGQVLRLGQYVWAVWTGGDVGAQAVLTVTGTKEIPGGDG